LPDDSAYALMKLAHEQDITFNQLIEKVLRDAIDNNGLLDKLREKYDREVTEP